MIEFMDEVAESVIEFAKGATETAAELLIIAAKAMIVLTAPVWLLPYLLLRDNNGGICEKPDCINCPFPPCEKPIERTREKEND